MSKKHKVEIKAEIEIENEKKKYLQILLIALCLIALVVYIYFITKPEIIVYDVKDECGPIGGSISHTIGNIDKCNNGCLAHCQSFKHTFQKSEFIEREGPQCNLCTCYCKV